MYGYHEGYLVTPISTGTLVAGNILAGRRRRVDRGRARARGGRHRHAAAARERREPRRGVPDRVPDVPLDRGALVPALRARAGARACSAACSAIINVLLFFPSGALYPIESYPTWLAEARGDRPADLRRARPPQPAPARRGSLCGLRRLGLSGDFHARVRGPDEGAVPAGGVGEKSSVERSSVES